MGSFESRRKELEPFEVLEPVQSRDELSRGFSLPDVGNEREIVEEESGDG